MRSFKITNDAHPNIPALMLATHRAIIELGGSASVGEIQSQVVDTEGVSEDEQLIGMNNDPRSKLNYYLAWARTYLRRGGAIENSGRGVWSIDEQNTKISDIDDCHTIYAQVNAEERERDKIRRLARKEASDNSASSQDDEQGGDEEFVENDTKWEKQLLAVLFDMDPSAFERLCQRLLREAGFTKVSVRGKVGDGGIDGIGVLRVNLVSFQVYFQCKRWRGSVGSKEIRDFRGALQGRADKGIFISTGSFTKSAVDEATRDGAIAIDLINGEMLCSLLKDHSLGVSTRLVEEIDIDKRWFTEI